MLFKSAMMLVSSSQVPFYVVLWLCRFRVRAVLEKVDPLMQLCFGGF